MSKPTDDVAAALGAAQEQVRTAVAGALAGIEQAVQVRNALLSEPPKVTGQLTREAGARVVASLKARGEELACLHGFIWLLLLVKREEKRNAR